MKHEAAVLHTGLGSARRAPARLPIDRIVHPRSVAVFGASESVTKFGGRIMAFLVRHGFAGEIYPINPNRPEVIGHKAYPRISEVPAAPDVAILAVPMERMIESVSGAADAGVGCCVIITTGFAEADAQGAERQAELADIAARTGMRIVGPNCMGLIVPHHRMALCSSVVLDTDALGDGAIGFISQSGALMVSVFDRARTDGIGLRYGLSVGNQVDLETCDFLEFMIAERETRAICLYIEGLLDGQRFRRAARACREASKPLLVVKAGRTEEGVTAAMSHTASLAGSWEAFAAVCREEAVVLARDPDDMLRAARALIECPGVRPGRRVAVLSSSGGAAAIASDRVIESGLTLAPLTPQTRAALSDWVLAPQARNPVDLGARKASVDAEIVGPAMERVMADPTVDLGVVFLMSTPSFQKRVVAMAEAGRASGKPALVVCTPGAAADSGRAELRGRGFVVYDSFEQALRVLSLIAEHDRLRGRSAPVLERPAGLPGPAALASLNGGALTEREVKALLAAYGIPVAREEIVASPDGAAAAAARIGFPVVLKAVSRDIVHKSDSGAVRVGLDDAASVAAAAAAMQRHIADTAPSARVEGYSVQEMVRGEAELIVGVRRDDQFGPIVLIGLGGIAVEILHDVAVSTAPVAASRAREMIHSLKAAPLFSGARGQAPLDVEAIADAVERMSWLAHDLGERLVDLEVNPFIVRAQGGGIVAVDGRATLRTS